jgi:hypothetical protein
MYDAPLNAKARWWGDNNPMFGGANFSHAQKFGKFDLVLGGQAFATTATSARSRCAG